MPLRILVALGVEIVAAATCLLKPYWGFLFFIFWNVLRPQDDRPNVRELHYPMVLLISVMAGTLIRVAQGHFSSFLASLRQMFLFLAFYGVMITSALVTGYTSHSAYRVNEFLTINLTCLMLLFWATTATKVWATYGAFVAAGLFIARDALTRTSWMREQIGGQTFERMNMNRLNGNFGSPNYMALLMSVLIVVCLSFLYTRYSKFLKAAAIGAMGLFFYLFVKANSRGATLGLAAALLTFLLFQKRRAVTLGVLAIILVGVVALAPQSYFDRLKTISSYEQDSSATSRLELWNIGLQLIREHPLFGVGPENFMDYAFNGPHDSYIQAAAEMGIPAAFLYCAILVSGYVAGFRAFLLSRKGDENLRAVSVASLCIVSHMVVQGLTTGFAHREFVYYFIACAYATQRAAVQQANDEQTQAASGPALPYSPARA